MNTQLVLFVLLLFCLESISSLSFPPVVRITDGILRGTTFETRKGRNISAFLGIPYAQPPLGKLRFSSPLPVKSWNGIFMADKWANMCPQPAAVGEDKGNEDCLYLNVFTPFAKFKATKFTFNNNPLPVMVWIHGGSFLTGSSNSFSPNYLMDKNIVLVTINYRLGILGFLSTGDSVAPGNFGMKDQIFALKWVQKNIQFFGGDRNHVTIFGESAGGAAVHLHAFSDASHGLFHQYIIQSGNALSSWCYRDRSDYKQYLNKVAQKIGCSTISSEILIKCLREANFVELLEAIEHNNSNFPELSWIPTNELESENAFLTDSPRNLMAQKKMKDLPFMSGTVQDEGLLITLTFYNNPTEAKLIRFYLENCITFISKFYSVSNNTEEIKTKIKDYYFKESIISNDHKVLIENFTKFVSDGGFFYPQLSSLDKTATFAKNPFYLYSFGYHGDMMGSSQNIGVSHGEDIFYIFPGPSAVSKADNEIVDLMVDLWTTFAENGKPTTSRWNDPNIWLPYTENNSFLQIGNIQNNSDPSVTLDNKFFTNRMNFWRENVGIN